MTEYTYVFETDPFRHQDEIFLHTRDAIAWGLLMEMGTGKSKVAIDTAVYLWERGRIDGVLVVAPNMVHRNWITDEIPRHKPKRCRGAWLDWHSRRAKHRRQLAGERALLDCDGLPWLSMSYDGVLTKAGAKFVRAFITKYPRFLLIVDESTRCKTPSTDRTRRMQAIANLAAYKRILTGTPVTNGPFDIYSQIKLLDERFWWRHGLDTYAAFTSRFGVFKTIQVTNGPKFADGRDRIMDGKGPESIVLAGKREVMAYDAAAAEAFEQIDPEALAAFMTATDPLYSGQAAAVAELQAVGMAGPDTVSKLAAQSTSRSVCVRVAFKDVEHIHSMIAPIVSRVTKESAGLNLPPKLYNRIPIVLAPEQRKAYDRMRTEYMLEMEDGALITAPIAMVRLLRLHQIACGYLPNPSDPEGDPIMFPSVGEEPRLAALLDLLEDVPHKAIIWARFRVDIDRICAALGDRCVRIDGTVTSPTARAEAIRRFRDPAGAQFFVANPAAIAMGITLTEAKTVIYFSNSFSLEQREQSEDRPHRIGQDQPVLYYDLVAENTIDERIIECLRKKKVIAAQVTGDALREWLT